MDKCNFILGKMVSSRHVVFCGDILLVLISVVLAYLLRFNFSIPDSELYQLPEILIFITAVRIFFFILGRSYVGIIKYINIIDMLYLYIFTFIGSCVFIFANVLTYYFMTNRLFIPLTIIILEFLITTFLLLLFRGIISAKYSNSEGK